MEPRQQRGLVIAAVMKLKWDGGTWIVPSQSSTKRYRVQIGGDKPTCTCPDHESLGCKCKHIYAAEFVVQREHTDSPRTQAAPKADPGPPESAAKKKTYGQDWTAYNEAQTNEKRLFQTLLRDLCRGIQDPREHGRGRPKLPLSDAAFMVVFKTYSTFSGRRFVGDMLTAHEQGHMESTPHFNSVFTYLKNPILEPVLTDLVVRSSLPMSTVETDFAVDSTGFGSSRFVRWYDHKYGAPRQKQDWVKCHLMCGVKTHIVTGVQITDRRANDYPILAPLVKNTARNFNLAEVSADKAYSGHTNLATIVAHGASPYIPFTALANGRNGGLFGKMYHLFCLNQEEFFRHYHKRSNVESTVSMIKSKFRDNIRSRTQTAMRNEVLTKVVCHNLCCLVGAIYELGIEPKFEALAG